MAFLRDLINRELAAAVSESNRSETSAENAQEPEFKKRRRRRTKLDDIFEQLNDAGQLNILEHAKIVSQLPEFQLHPPKPDIYSVLTEKEGAQLKGILLMLDEAKYERFQLVDGHEPEGSDKMRSNTEQIAQLNESIAKIITGAVKRTEPQIQQYQF